MASDKAEWLDDRGRPLPPLDSGISGASARWFQWMLLLGLVGGIAGSVMFGMSANLIFPGMILICVPALYVSAWRAARRSRACRLPPRVAWTAAYQRCGACTYDLAGIDVGPDGLAVCPECGAAWHRDRWTHPPKGEMGRFASTLTAVEANGLDDRGCPLTQYVKIRPYWAQSRKDASARLDAAYGRLGELAVQRLSSWTPILLVGMVTIVALVYGLVERTEPRLAGAGIYIAMFVGVASAMAFFRTEREQAAQVLVSLRFCPNCGADFDGPPGFDGCAACRQCGRAWKKV